MGNLTFMRPRHRRALWPVDLDADYRDWERGKRTGKEIWTVQESR